MLAGEDAAQFVGRNNLELRVGALCGGLVGSPAAELGEVAEAVLLHVLVGDFDDELGAQRDPA